MAGPTPKTRRRRTIGGAGLTRMLSLLAFLPVASRVPDYARLVTALVLDERMPEDRKVLLGAAAGYLVLGRDLDPGRPADHRRARRPRRRRPRRRPVPRWRAARPARGEARSTSTSTARRSTATSPRSGA